MKYFILPFMVLFLCVSFSVEGQSGYSDPYVNTSGRSTSSKRPSRSKRTAQSARRPRSARSAGVVPGQTQTSVRSARRPRSARSAGVISTQTQTSARSARRARGGISSSQSGQQQAPARSASVLTSAGSPVIAPSAADLTATSGQMYAQPANPADKEEQLLLMEAGKERFQACLDDFCNDTESVNPAGRCLCSANIAKLKPLEDSVNKKMKQLFQMTSNVEAAKLGMQYELFDESILEKMGINEDEDEENPWDIDNVDYGLDALLEGDSKRKEGLALFKDAMAACKPYLDATSSFKTYIVDAYEASAQKSCRGYENLLTDKLRRADLAMQATYNKIQKTEQKTVNAYNSSQCSQKLHACMAQEAGCGENFTECATRQRLEERKLYCKSETLDRCQDVADAVWEDFVRNAIRIGVDSIDEQSGICARDLQTCFEEGGYCGEDNLDCATPVMMADKKALCYDKIAPCNEKAEDIWRAFVNSVVSKGSAAKASIDVENRAREQRMADAARAEEEKMAEAERVREEKMRTERERRDLAEQQQNYQKCARDLQSCALSQCGTGGIDCRTDALAENIRGLCAASLIPCAEKADSIWSAFKKAIIARGSATYQQQVDSKKILDTCPAGYQKIGGQCRKALISPPAPKTCSSGYEYKYGRCVKTPVSSVTTKCPTGSTLQNGRCVRNYYPSKDLIKYNNYSSKASYPMM
ncbi:MAG: hypothetical protein JW812_01780 [Alphaproteobacteria bacterium]|nr:hypothetical protein [Alphaproteobacteria bacterium]MBN2780059.1 hypothetical protein [Alphaproteobacteria bacterium]